MFDTEHFEIFVREVIQWTDARKKQDRLLNHISAVFVETVDWWIKGNMQESPEQITTYFLTAVEPMIKIN